MGITLILFFISCLARKQDTQPRVVVTDPDNLVKHASIGDNVTISCTFDVGGSTTGLLDVSIFTLYSTYTHFDASAKTTFKNVGKGEIAFNEQFFLFPQCFLLN